MPYRRPIHTVNSSVTRFLTIKRHTRCKIRTRLFIRRTIILNSRRINVSRAAIRRHIRIRHVPTCSGSRRRYHQRVPRRIRRIRPMVIHMRTNSQTTRHISTMNGKRPQIRFTRRIQRRFGQVRTKNTKCLRGSRGCNSNFTSVTRHRNRYMGGISMCRQARSPNRSRRRQVLTLSTGRRVTSNNSSNLRRSSNSRRRPTTGVYLHDNSATGTLTISLGLMSNS